MLRIQKALFTIVIAGSLFLSSCIGTRLSTTARSASFLPSYVEMRVTMDDYQFLGTEEVSVSYRRYLGIFNYYNTINGKDVPARNISIVNVQGASSVGLNRHLRRALFAAMTKFPDADFIVPVSIYTETDRMFLGRSNNRKLKVKIYKIKEK